MRIEDMYDAAQGCGLLTPVIVGAEVVWCGFRAPDDPALDGLVLSRDYAIDFPASRLRLTSGGTVIIGGNDYTVRDIRALRDGAEMRATLSKR